ncbi:MAG: hypothetical protein D6781_04150 [Verrucomicrobia bacterium]|nr:MAG: hypothetical protein D6781_04150 [Verrucomicrobiota bacterium]
MARSLIALGILLILAREPVAFGHQGHSDGKPLTFASLLEPLGDDVEIRKLQDGIRQSGTNGENLLALGWAFIARARRSQSDHLYSLALLAADSIQDRPANDAPVLFLKGHALHNLHRFAEAETVARELIAVRGAPADHGLLSDALMEQGRIEEAAAACQRFIDGQPGLESYSRAAHLRWLTGDIEGAADLMAAALRAGSPVDPEALAWAATRLSFYSLQLGDAEKAQALAAWALLKQPAYPPALLARGRASLALGKAQESVSDLQQAASVCPLPNYQWWLAEALREVGEDDRAASVELALIRQGSERDPRAVALFLATRGIASRPAVTLATADLENRQDALTHDTLAFALYRAGNLPEAEKRSRAALATGLRDARVFLHAGLIAAKLGHSAEAARHLENAAHMDGTLTPSERRILATALRAAAPPVLPNQLSATAMLETKNTIQ